MLKTVSHAVALLLFMATTLFSFEYSISYKTALRHVAKPQILLNTTRALHLDTDSRYDYAHITVYDSSYTVFLYTPKSYSVEIYQLAIQSDTVFAIMDKESDLPSDPDLYAPCASCPDPSVQVLISNFKSDMIPTCDSFATIVSTAFNAAGVKTVQLRNEQETMENVKSWLNCPNLKMWGRIGHGSNGSGGALILGAHGVPTGYLRTSEVAALAPLLKGKIFPFNSCYVGGVLSPIIKNMVANGALFGVGGNDVSLGSTYSEPVWAKFMKEIVVTKKEIGQSSRDVLDKAALERPGPAGTEFACTFKNPGSPLYFSSLTAALPLPVQNSHAVGIAQTKSYVTFAFPLQNRMFETSIIFYSSTGKTVFQQKQRPVPIPLISQKKRSALASIG